MIKSALTFYDSSDHILIQIFRKYQKNLKSYLDSMIQIFSHILNSDNIQKLQKLLNENQTLQKKQIDIYNTLRIVHLTSLPDKSNFDKFCLRIYQIIQTFIQQLKKNNKNLNLDLGGLMPKVQLIFSLFKTQEHEINVGQFIYKIVQLRQKFALNILKKINQKISLAADQINRIKDVMKNKLINQKRDSEQIFKFKSIILKVNQNEISEKSKNNPSQKQIIIEQQNKKPRRRIIKLQCKHCKCLQIIEATNLNQVYHYKYSNSYQNIYNNLLEKNIQNKDIIKNYVRSTRVVNLKQSRLKYLKQTQRKRSISFVKDHMIQAKLEKIREANISHIQSEKKSISLGSRFLNFQRIWSKQKQLKKNKDLSFITKTLFPKIFPV